MRRLAAGIDFEPITAPGGYQPTGSGISDYTSVMETLISNVLVVLTAVAGISFALYFLLGGLNWITAGGQKDKIETAKSMMTNGAIGLIVITVSYSVVWIVSTALGLKVLEPGFIIDNNILFQ